jgi:ubiquinone/menaquinone biosynthesis C-methylase UbiE
MHRHSGEEWFEKYASELLAIFPCRGTLLDVGCGSCQVTSYLAPYFQKVYALDFSETMLTAARHRVESLGLTNLQLCSGTAQEFPTAIEQVDVILSYGVVQYLTLEEFARHLFQCRRVLADAGTVCVALIPNLAFRSFYYYNRLVPHRTRIRAWTQLMQRRARAYFAKDLLWDGVGNWFYQDDIRAGANQTGFDVEFRNSWFYEYRFHGILRLRSSIS